MRRCWWCSSPERYLTATMNHQSRTRMRRARRGKISRFRASNRTLLFTAWKDLTMKRRAGNGISRMNSKLKPWQRWVDPGRRKCSWRSCEYGKVQMIAGNLRRTSSRGHLGVAEISQPRSEPPRSDDRKDGNPARRKEIEITKRSPSRKAPRLPAPPRASFEFIPRRASRSTAQNMPTPL